MTDGRPNGAMPVLGAVTAAGRSRRMGAPKPLLVWDGRTLLARILATLREVGIVRPAVIVAPGAAAIRAEALAAGGLPLVNVRAAAGRFTSIRLAARWALAHPRARDGALALLLWPVDCPAVAAATVRRLIEAARSAPGCDVVPVHRGRGGHPVLLGRGTLKRVAASDDDGHLRELIGAGRRPPLRIAVGDGAVLDNLNDPGDLARFASGDRREVRQEVRRAGA